MFRKSLSEGGVTDAAFPENVPPGRSSALALLRGRVEVLRRRALSAFPGAIRALTS